LLLGGKLIDCELKDANDVYYGRDFFNYQFAIAPSVALFNNTLSLHASVDGPFGRFGSDERGEGIRYGNGYMERCYCDPVWVSQRYYNDRAYGGIADNSFVKFREVGARYELPGIVLEKLGADRASVTVSGRELALLYREDDWMWG